MDSTVEIREDVSDPLKHLLSLDWNSSATLTAIENSFEPTKSVKRVRFSEEVEKISYDSSDEKILDVPFTPEENTDDTEMNADLPTYSNENRTDIFSEETEFTNFELPFNDGDTVDSITNDINDNSKMNSGTEISIAEQKEDNSVNENSEQNSLLLEDIYESNLLKSSIDLEEETSDLNEVTNQVENLSLENASSESITSESHLKPDSEPSDFNMLNNENSINVGELKSNASDGSSIASKRRVKTKLYNEKQSWKLNSVLTENSSYSSASELNSAVYKAWCEVKNKTKSVETAVSNENNVSKRQTPSNSAYLTWRKSKTDALKKSKKDKPSSNFPNMQKELSKNSKEDIEMVFKAWKKKKDEIMKQKISEKFNKEQEQVVESLMEKKEKKMEADAAFNAWKQHKYHLMKLEKKKRAWIMQKKREEEEQKIARDREALIVYHMWLESKNSAKHNNFSPIKAKPPWTPPGKCEQFFSNTVYK